MAVAFAVIIRSQKEVKRGTRFVNENEQPFYFSVRKIEKYVLYSAKHILQTFIVLMAKYWFIGVTKTKQFINTRFPKIKKLFEKKEIMKVEKKTLTFLGRAVKESKIKIKRMREHVRETHGVKEEK